MAALCEISLSLKDFRRFQALIYELAGISLAESKLIMVQGRLAKRLRSLNLTSYGEYANYLSGPRGADEAIEFVNCLTTNKTDFYRELHHFEFLRTTLFPAIEAQASITGERKLRIWSAACSTGEEPYSLAMTVRNYFPANSGWDIRILASDIDTHVLEHAARGVFLADRMTDVPNQDLAAYFETVDKGDQRTYEARPALKDLITFRRINFKQFPWPINIRFDVIFCRNVMIYFDAQTQRELVGRFAEYLNPDGHLVIGHSESLLGLSDQFQSLGDTIYRVRNASRTATPASNAGSIKPARQTVRPNDSATHPLPLVKSAQQGLDTRGTRVETTPAPTTNRVPSRSSSAGLPAVIPMSDKHPIIVGEVFASADPIWICTLLGSCVAACLYDEQSHVGGMNHFMLPNSTHEGRMCSSYGVHAMEMLINEIMAKGGDRRRLKAKLFGGGAVVRSDAALWNVGERNIEFAKQFLQTESIPLVASHTGGQSGMQVNFHTFTATARVRLLDPNVSANVAKEESRQSEHSLATANESPSVTLF